MAFGDQALAYVERKKAGMQALLLNWAGVLEGYAKGHADWADRTGHARQGLHAGVDRRGPNELTLYLSHGEEYGVYLELGTPPHIIRPVEKKALYWHGAAHPVREVHHPGTRPHAIVLPTMDAHLPRIRQSILDYWGAGR
ncbi:MAG: hypothetical protein ACM3XZ_02770 [Betaproteobacteria bacterium]